MSDRELRARERRGELTQRDLERHGLACAHTWENRWDAVRFSHVACAECGEVASGEERKAWRESRCAAGECWHLVSRPEGGRVQVKACVGCAKPWSADAWGWPEARDEPYFKR